LLLVLLVCRMIRSRNTAFKTVVQCGVDEHSQLSKCHDCHPLSCQPRLAAISDCPYFVVDASFAVLQFCCQVSNQERAFRKDPKKCVNFTYSPCLKPKFA
jgi:hypothetical protein